MLDDTSSLETNVSGRPERSIKERSAQLKFAEHEREPRDAVTQGAFYAPGRCCKDCFHKLKGGEKPPITCV